MRTSSSRNRSDACTSVEITLMSPRRTELCRACVAEAWLLKKASSCTQTAFELTCRRDSRPVSQRAERQTGEGGTGAHSCEMGQLRIHAAQPGSDQCEAHPAHPSTQKEEQ